MGCGFDKDGRPYLCTVYLLSKPESEIWCMTSLWFIVPKRYGQKVMALVGDAFRRAAAEVMHQVIMEFDGHNC